MPPRPRSRLADVRRLALLTLVGLCGLAVAVGVTMAASHLTNEDIGLNSEPLTAGRELVPPAAVRKRARPRATTTTTPPPPATTTQRQAPPAPAISTEPGDDSGARGGGGGHDNDGD